LNILVRNLSTKITEKDLLQIFQKIGKVITHNIVMDKDTGRSKGFGFVEMLNDYEAAAAIKTLNGRRINGQIIRVKAANKTDDHVPVNADRPRPARYVTKNTRDAGRVRKDPARGSRRQGFDREAKH
jgi:RNA recognition motif-containing protein